MPLFRRKTASAIPRVMPPGTNGSRPPGMTGQLLVGAVSEPGRPAQSETALVSGLLLGPFPVQLVQFTAVAQRATWPSPGTELRVTADPASPLNFEVTWGEAPDDGSPAPLVPAQSGLSGWDPGPGGAHARALADWLAAAGFTAGDFGGPALDRLAPGMTSLLDAASARYASVIRGQEALALMRAGEPAQGEVTAVRTLQFPPQMLPGAQASMVWLTLIVTPQGGEPYEVTIRFGFRSPERLAELATAGTKLPLRVDPADSLKVTIDLPALGITPA
jgi:hypothetical protein